MEAAKAVKYGDVDPEEALKFVTLNVAKQLKIEDRVGSIAPGMDADLAVWTANPLSSFARCERTFVDGREMFSIERDAELRANAIAERDRIIQKIIAGEKAKPQDNDDAETETEAARALDLLAAGDASPSEMIEAYRLVQRLASLEEQYLFRRRNGIDPLATRPGECGCDEQSLLSQTR
jgi:adenine deaminase